jgi:hypothetical protein
MVLPIPMAAVGGSVSVPPSLVSKMNWIFGALLGCELATSGLRFYFLDIWGGVIMTLISIFGIFVMRYKFDLQWVVMFGVTIFFYGLIHFVMMLERMVMVWPSFPDLEAPDKRIIIRDIVFMVSPVIDWTLTGLCWYMFRSATSYAFGGTAEERQPLARSNTRSSATTSSTGFVPFSGEGHKLASSN